MNNFDNEKDIGVAMSDKNLPGTPQCEKLDFFRLLIIFDTSIGDVLMAEIVLYLDVLPSLEHSLQGLIQ